MKFPTIEENGYEWKIRLLDPKAKQQGRKRKLSQPYTSAEDLVRLRRMKQINYTLKTPSISPERKEKLLKELKSLRKIKLKDK